MFLSFYSYHYFIFLPFSNDVSFIYYCCEYRKVRARPAGALEIHRERQRVYNKSLANLILPCIYALHCYQHQFSSSPFYNNAASCVPALLLIKAAFSARSPIARLTPQNINIWNSLYMRGRAHTGEREREGIAHPMSAAACESARRALCCKIITKRIIKKDECKKSKSTFKWCVCAVCWCLMGRSQWICTITPSHSQRATKPLERTFQTPLVKKYWLRDVLMSRREIFLRDI